MIRYFHLCTLFFLFYLNGNAQVDQLLKAGYDKFNKRNFEGAIQDFNQVLIVDKENKDALCGRAEARINLGSYSEAMKDIEAALSIDDNYSRTYSLKGEILYNQKDYHGALESYEEALIKPDPPSQAIIGKSKALNQLGNTREAFRILDDAIARLPTNAEFYYARGMLNNTKERYSKSISDFEKALIVNPDLNPFGNYLNRGIAYLNLDEQESAIKDLSKAIEIDPKSATAYHSRGLAYYQAGEYKESVDDFLMSSDLSPNNPVTYYNLGMAYYKLGEKENACVYFHKSCQLDNTNSCKMIILNCSERSH